MDDSELELKSAPPSWLVPLNLPPIAAKISHRKHGHTIWDRYRKKHVALTPEEWVRQHLLAEVLTQTGAPPNLLAVEHGLKYGELQKRADAVIFDKQGKVWMLVECKAPDVALSHLVMHQILTYASVLRPSFLLVSNGLTHWLGKPHSQLPTFVVLPSMPAFPS